LACIRRLHDELHRLACKTGCDEEKRAHAARLRLSRETVNGASSLGQTAEVTNGGQRVSDATDRTGERDYSARMDTIIVEIRAAEGGDDAKALVRDQLSIYARYCDNKRL
jgi:hypothetical protein